MKNYQIHQDIAYREIEGETLIIHSETSEIFVLNDTGKLIWESLQQKMSLDQIKEALMHHYSISSEEVMADVAQFLSQLLKHEFIKEIDA